MASQLRHEGARKHGYTIIELPVLLSPNLNALAKTVYAQLARFADLDKTFPSRETIASWNGLHPSTIDEAIKELKAVGLLKTKRQGLGRSNLYFVSAMDDGLAEKLLAPVTQSPVTQKLPSTVNTESPTSLINKTGNTNNTFDTKVSKGAPGALTVVKGDDELATQNSLFKLPEPAPPSLPKDATNSQKAMHHVSEARAGRLTWDKVSDRDFAHYYVVKHNGCMPKLVNFDMYSSIGIIRDSLVKTYSIPREKVCDYIDNILAEYQNHPDKQDWLSFNMVQKNGPLMNQLVELVRRKLETVERKFQTNVAPMKLGKVEEGETF